jgi:hypothetical protein
MARPFLDLSSGFKTCPKCKVEKALSEFHKSKSSVHGITVYCKQCSGEKHKTYMQGDEQKAQAAKRSREWRANNPERQRDLERRANYGVEPGTYDRMLKEQNGQCAICRTPDPGGRGCFHIDHCHSTKQIRGLLCHHCNVGIGHMGHDPDRLRAAVHYLTKSSAEG